MDVKGVAFLARQSLVVKQHGEAAWRAFLTDFARREPVFAQPVMPISRIPAPAFIAFNDALLAHFEGGDPQAYWRYGEASGRYALVEGQLKGMFGPGEFRRFLQFSPAIWRGYFTAGELRVQLKDAETTDLHIVGVPHPHVYFEYAVMGFAKAGLELLSPKALQVERLGGFSQGDPEVHYRVRAA